jgi:hypothetical protein
MTYFRKKIKDYTMKKICLIGFFLTISFVGNSCRKNVIKVDENYVGDWTEERHGSNTCYWTLNISNDGFAHYGTNTHLSDCMNRNKIKGKAKVNKNSMRIGIYTYSISMKPTFIDTLYIFDQGKFNMKMVFDGRTLLKRADK